MSKARLFFVAAEASGDLLAREVIEEIRNISPDTDISGIGGEQLEAIGIRSPIDISSLSVLGLFEGLLAYNRVVRMADAATAAIIEARPDVVVLVDSWGFMLRVAQRVRMQEPSIRLVKLIGPQVWATRPGRARTLAATVDHLLCMHELETPYYEPYGLPTTTIGNPALSREFAGDKERFFVETGLSPSDPILLVFPGSRASELKRVAPSLVAAASFIKESVPGVQIVFAPSSSIAEQFNLQFVGINQWAHVLENPESRYDAMAAATVALACSGTVTSEIAMIGTPMLVAYKTGWITWMLARGLLYKKKHITLLNIVNNDQEIVPEFVQTKLDAKAISEQATSWLMDSGKLSRQRKFQSAALSKMQEGGHDAAAISANAILLEADKRTRGLLA